MPTDPVSAQSSSACAHGIDDGLPCPYCKPAGVQYVEYDRVDATEIDQDGTLWLYRRRGPFGLLRQQEIFHPAGEWLTFLAHPSGKIQVTVR